LHGILAAPAAGRQAARPVPGGTPAEEVGGKGAQGVAEEAVSGAGGIPRHLPRRREQGAHQNKPAHVPDQTGARGQAQLRPYIMYFQFTIFTLVDLFISRFKKETHSTI